MRGGIRQGQSSFVKNSSIFKIKKLQKPQIKSVSMTSSENGAASTKILPSLELPINEESEWNFERMNFNQSLNSQKKVQTIFETGDEMKETSFEDGKASGVEYQKFLIIETVSSIVAFIGTFLAILAYEVEFDDSDPTLLESILWAGLVMNLFLVPLIVFRYLQLMKYSKARKMISKKTNLFTSKKLVYLGFEILILLLQPYPFFKGIRLDLYSDVEHIPYFYNLNDIFAILVAFRLYIVIRLYLNISVYRSPRARRITVMYGAKNDYLYACKCQMKEAPTLNVLFFFFLSIFVFGYMIRICERPLNRNDQAQKDFVNYSNSLWLMIITMTTVGYGDFFPQTHLGRLIAIFACLWGVFVVSLIFVSLSNILTLTAVETKSLTVLKRLNLRKKLKMEAANILTKIARMRINSKYSLRYKSKYHSQHLKRYLNRFRQNLRQLKNTNENVSLTEEMHLRFNIITDTVHELIQNQNTFDEVLQNINQKILNNDKLELE